MYRFLRSPGWLGRLAAAVALAAVMSMLGVWQLDRYEQRSLTNERIAAAADAAPEPLARVVPAPAGSAVGPPPSPEAEWSLVSASGRYDPDHEVLVRTRTVAGQVGVEVVTPLRLPDGGAVLVDRGWVPPAPGGAQAQPDAPAPPGGEVTVTGWVRPAERPAEVTVRGGDLTTRRIHTESLAEHLPYPLYGGYVQLITQQPPADPAFTPVPPRSENAWMNAGYAAQWWIFAGLVLVGFGWLARREARSGATGGRPRTGRDSRASATVQA